MALKTKTDPWARRFLAHSPVGHLATSTKSGKPQVVPVCFIFDGKSIYSSIDMKPKRIGPEHLRRVLNINENPRVSLVVDLYSEDWRELRYVIVNGLANIIKKGREHQRAVSLLRKKYHQYRSMRIEQRPIIRIRPRAFISWKS